jgi:phage terminase large subunit
MQIKIQATRVLQKTIEAEPFRILLHEGGSRSSKTWSIFQYFILKALQGESFDLTIVRDKLTWIRHTLLNDFSDIINKYGLTITPELNPSRQEQVYNINGSEFAFFGLDYPQKLHGRSQDYFWMNEVMEASKAAFDQLEMRTSKAGILDYNPTNDSHWVFDLVKRPDVKIIKSTMLDNPFLPEAIIRKIKSYEPTAENIMAGTADNYMWEVYGLGNKAKLVGLIYPDWDIVDDIPAEANPIGCGLDFGYSNDETALVAGYLFNNELYLDELIYKAGLTNDAIVKEMTDLDIDKNTTIWADSSEPKSIQEIYNLGFRGIRPIQKGADSINYGIDLLKQNKVHITRRSLNLDNERRKYKWAEDKTGKSLNKPIDAFNHLMDGCRYLAMGRLAHKPRPRVFENKPSFFG